MEEAVEEYLQMDVGPLKVFKEGFLKVTMFQQYVLKSTKFLKSRLIMEIFEDSHQSINALTGNIDNHGVFYPPWNGSYLFKSFNIPKETHIFIFVSSMKLSTVELKSSGTWKNLTKGDKVWFGRYSSTIINCKCLSSKNQLNKHKYCMIEILGLRNDL
jgi:hypothetical protein